MKHSLGEIIVSAEPFADVESIIEHLRSPKVTQLSRRKKFRVINEALFALIKAEPHPSFLLSAVIDFIRRVNESGFSSDQYTLTSFEFWLNNFSGHDDQTKREIRGKISGKYLPRCEYQGTFPVGMGLVFSGSHYVVAHLSPDIDTMVASFWSWVDSFSAIIGTGLHQWFLPGGPPSSPFTDMFQQMFGNNIFDAVATTSSSLSLTSMDLVTQQQLEKVQREKLASTNHAKLGSASAIIVVDERGRYIGDWHGNDFERTRQIVIPFKSCLRWFENYLHTHLIAFFAKNEVSLKDLPSFYETLFQVPLRDSEPALEFDEILLKQLDDFFCQILKVPGGLGATFSELHTALKSQGVQKLYEFEQALHNLSRSTIFGEAGMLNEDRPEIFKTLQCLIEQLDHAMKEARNYVERFDLLLQVKYTILNILPSYLTLRSDVEEMKNKMEGREFLAVVIQEDEGGLFPVGVVYASDLRKNHLATVSFRDFCNENEVKMAPHFAVISVIDHHKNQLKTDSVPSLLVADVQSCNVLLAEQAFALNDKFSMGGMTKHSIDKAIIATKEQSNLAGGRILQRLLQRNFAEASRGNHYVHPKREYCEYFCFLQAILDDTDLLSKVTMRDLECTKELLNRLRSLADCEEKEIISLDDAYKADSPIKEGVRIILQNKEMHSIYSYVYLLRQQSVEENLHLCAEGKFSNLFVDTKEQCGCARVGQSKLFKDNIPIFALNANEIRLCWLALAKEAYEKNSSTDLHLHMISTIPSAEEVYKDQIGPYQHQDELWIWIPSKNLLAQNHLNSFLASFTYGHRNRIEHYECELIGDETFSELHEIFAQHFPAVSVRKLEDNTNLGTLAIVKFDAGKVNSRKSMITPYLPKVSH